METGQSGLTICPYKKEGRNFAGKGTATKIAVMVTLLMVVIRFLHAACVYFAAPKGGEHCTIPSVLGVFSITFAFDTVMLVLVGLVSFLGIYEFTLAFLLCWLIGTALVSYSASLTFLDNEKALVMNIVIQLILAIIAVFAVRTMVVSAVGQAINQVTNMLKYFM